MRYSDAKMITITKNTHSQLKTSPICKTKLSIFFVIDVCLSGSFLSSELPTDVKSLDIIFFL